MDDLTRQGIVNKIEKTLDFGSETDDFAEYVSWLLADIRHYCDIKGVDFHKAEDRSYQIYLHERRG